MGKACAFRVPPIHPNCRSRLVWSADSDDDFAGVTGEDWVKGRTLEELQEQFGKGIGQMLHDGTISLHDAVRQGGLVPVTLSELQAQYGMSKNIVRTGWHQDFPSTVIDRKLGEATGHALYNAAKSGDASAAYRLASELVTDESVEKLMASVQGKNVVLSPVLAEETAGRNKIPLAVAAVVSAKTGWPLSTHIIQATKVSRTGSDGWYRLANAPEFTGHVVKRRHYVMVDDTQTQGGTFAAMKGYIERNGGTVAGAYALTGKQYSVQLKLSESTLKELREKYAEIEPWYAATFGYDFSRLTEWEAKFILNSRKSPDAVRNRIIAARNG